MIGQHRISTPSEMDEPNESDGNEELEVIELSQGEEEKEQQELPVNLFTRGYQPSIQQQQEIPEQVFEEVIEQVDEPVFEPVVEHIVEYQEEEKQQEDFE